MYVILYKICVFSIFLIIPFAADGSQEDVIIWIVIGVILVVAVVIVCVMVCRSKYQISILIFDIVLQNSLHAYKTNNTIYFSLSAKRPSPFVELHRRD